MYFKDLSLKKRSVLTAIFLLTAYGVLIGYVTDSAAAVFSADLVSGFSVICIAVLMFDVFKPFGKRLSHIYLLLKTIEGLLMITGGFFFLNPALQNLRNSLYDGIHLYVFIISAALFYYLLYKSKAVPSFISLWGGFGISSLVLSTVINLCNIDFVYIDYFLILIITNELFLAVWLMTKGLKIYHDFNMP